MKSKADKKIEIWAEDEGRIGLHPILRRVWAKKGQRPIAKNHTRYQWVYAYAFVNPRTGDTSWTLLPTVSALTTNIALQEFKREVDPENKKHIVLLLDQAGFHVSKDVVVPEGIEFYHLPPYTPELQPVECIWPLLKETCYSKKSKLFLIK